MIRFLYRVLSALSTGRAASRGPRPLANNLIRRAAHRTLAQMLRGLLR
jgi:hypothetical protein